MQIHELPEAASAADTDQIAIDTGTNTKKFTILGLLRKIIGTTSIADIGDGTPTGAIKALSERGVVYAAAWTATASSAVNVALTDAIQLPAGTYVALATVPIADNANGLFLIAGTGMTSFKATATYNQLVNVFTLASAATVRVLSASSQTVNYSVLDRGGLRVVKLA